MSCTDLLIRRKQPSKLQVACKNLTMTYMNVKTSVFDYYLLTEKFASKKSHHHARLDEIYLLI